MCSDGLNLFREIDTLSYLNPEMHKPCHSSFCLSRHPMICQLFFWSNPRSVYDNGGIVAMPPLEIITVSNESELDVFINLPWKIYARDTNWVPPLKKQVRRLLDPAKHPFSWKFSERVSFWRGGALKRSAGSPG